MPTITRNAIATTHLTPTAETAATICFLPAERLRTTYAPLRPGAPVQLLDDGAELPIRVVPTEEDTYEVIDGFKWKRERYLAAVSR